MAPFDSLAGFRDALAQAPSCDHDARRAAEARNDRLTKPWHSLGRLEELAIWVAGWHGTDRPRIERPQVAVFAGNHGVTARAVSAFPPQVTALMVANFAAGGAGINQIARAVGVRLTVTPVELDRPTADFTEGPAMSEADLVAGLAAGWDAVGEDTDLLVPGEMGIGNTTAAAAIAAAVFGGTGAQWAGRGAGIDDQGLARKVATVDAGLAANPSARGDGLEALRCLGGREIAAMAGAIACARVRGIPTVIDGFICTSAAIALSTAVPRALEHVQAGHQSAEAAHQAMLAHLELDPILSLGMRLGEGTGGTLAVAVVRAACECLSGMATFAEAGIAAN